MSNAVQVPQYVVPKEILFADHFTDDSSRALGYARAVAFRFGGHVTVTHVNEPENPIVSPDGSGFEALGPTPRTQKSNFYRASKSYALQE